MTVSDSHVAPAGDTTNHQDNADHRQPADEAASSRTKLSLQAAEQLTKPAVSSNPREHHSGWSTAKTVAKDIGIGYGLLVAVPTAAFALFKGGEFIKYALSPVARPTEEFVASHISDLAPAWKELAANGIRTSDPLRTLIQMPHYGYDLGSAKWMEEIIAGSRDAVEGGKITNAAGLESNIATNYLRQAHARQAGFRLEDNDQVDFRNAIRNVTRMRIQQAKHYEFTTRLDPGWWSGQRYEAEIGGQTFWTHTIRKRFGALEFVVPKPDKNPFARAADQRVEELFKENLASRQLDKTPENLQKGLERVAEMEWLKARTWTYTRGTSGISQLGARTSLEVAGIDSGRFAPGIDPNTEALITPLDVYKKKYPTFFEKPPTYFSDSAI